MEGPSPSSDRFGANCSASSPIEKTNDALSSADAPWHKEAGYSRASTGIQACNRHALSVVLTPPSPRRPQASVEPPGTASVMQHPGGTLPAELWQRIAEMCEPEHFAKGRHRPYARKMSTGVYGLMASWRAAREALLRDTSLWHACQYESKIRTRLPFGQSVFLEPRPGCTGLGPYSSILKHERYLNHPRSASNLFFLRNLSIHDGWDDQHWTLNKEFPNPLDKRRLEAQVDLICERHPRLDENRLVALFDQLWSRRAPLHTLEFRYCHGLTARVLEAATRFPQLRNLTFLCTDLDDEGLAIVCRKTQLTSLNITEGSRVSASGLGHLERLRALSNLYLRGFLRYPDGDEILPDALVRLARKLPELRSVTFSYMVNDLHYPEQMRFLDNRVPGSFKVLEGGRWVPYRR